jgi:hypothetical protein
MSFSAATYPGGSGIFDSILTTLYLLVYAPILTREIVFLYLNWLIGRKTRAA